LASGVRLYDGDAAPFKLYRDRGRQRQVSARQEILGTCLHRSRMERRFSRRNATPLPAQ
jgi:hypothetical protein